MELQKLSMFFFKVDHYTQYVCQTVPLQCKENATFLVDTDKLRRFLDLPVDDNGLWIRPSGSNLYIKKTERVISPADMCSRHMNFNSEKVYIHTGTPNFHKVVYTMKDSKGHNTRYIIIQCYFQDGNVPVL